MVQSGKYFTALVNIIQPSFPPSLQRSFCFVFAPSLQADLFSDALVPSNWRLQIAEALKLAVTVDSRPQSEPPLVSWLLAPANNNPILIPGMETNQKQMEIILPSHSPLGFWMKKVQPRDTMVLGISD